MSLFVKSQFVKNIKFDTSFRIAADLDFLNKLIVQTNNVIFVDKTFSYFSMHGVSSIDHVKTLRESRKVAIRNGKNIFCANIFYFYKAFRVFSYSIFGNTKIYKVLKTYLKKGTGCCL